MFRIFLLLTCVGLSFSSLAQQNNNTSTSTLSEKIDQYIQRIQKRHDVPGVALAVIKDGKVIHRKNYGYANLEHRVPVSDQSLFRLYSLSKPIVVVGLFSLIEKGKLSLEDKVSDYMTGLPETWQKIQIKHLLSHSSGLPDMGQPYDEVKDLSEEAQKQRVFALPLAFDPGEHYQYNQTNFWLLQRIIEKGSQSSLSDFITKNQFNPVIDTVFFSSDARDIIPNRATPYFPFDKPGVLTITHPHYAGDYSYAMNGLHLSLNDFIAWDKKFSQQQLINQQSIDKMWENFPFEDPREVFTYGWSTYNLNGHPSYGFSGSGSTIYRVFPEDNLSIIFLANGFSSWYNLSMMINYMAQLVEEDIFHDYSLFNEKLLSSLEDGGISETRNSYQQLKKDSRYNSVPEEACLNDIGYWLLNRGETAKAIGIFRLNAEEHPTSWNVHDSLGEAYELNQQFEKALTNYQKALQLNTLNQGDHNTILEERIERLKKR